MSQFTTILHDGRELQIKTGWDSCERLQVGHIVTWSPRFFSPGQTPNGVHGACELDGLTYWVVIRDNVVLAVHPESEIDPQRSPVWALGLHYRLQLPERWLWPELAWEARAWQRRKQRQERKRLLSAEDAVNAYTRAKLREPGITSRLFWPREPQPSWSNELNRWLASRPPIDWADLAQRDMTGSAESYLFRRWLEDHSTVDRAVWPYLIERRSEDGQRLEVYRLIQPEGGQRA